MKFRILLSGLKVFILNKWQKFQINFTMLFNKHYDYPTLKRKQKKKKKKSGEQVIILRLIISKKI